MINKRYKILHKLGEGRSKVFLCTDSFYPGEKFAIKVLSNKSDQDEKKSFRNEYYILRKFEHPNIIAPFGKGIINTLSKEYRKYGIEKNDLYLVTEYFDGVELAEYDWGNDEATLKEIIKKIAVTLYYLHTSNYIYFDLKPENILINRSGNDIDIKFIDFGFTTYAAGFIDATQRGTPQYIAPEILQKSPVDHRVDMYSFGVLIYQLIYKKLPFEGKTALEYYKAHLEEKVNFTKTRYSADLMNAVKKLLAKDPADRYYSLLSFLSSAKIPLALNDKLSFNPALQRIHVPDPWMEIESYLAEKEPQGKILVINGKDGAGKTSLLEKIEEEFTQSVFLSAQNTVNKNSFWMRLVFEVVNNTLVFGNIDSSIVQYIDNHLTSDNAEFITELKSILGKISLNSNYILLIDDIHLLDKFSIEILNQVMPILQANGIHIIVTSEIDLSETGFSAKNVDSVVQTSFNEKQISQLINESFCQFADRDTLIKLICEYTDLFPKSVRNFINDLIKNGILEFLVDGPAIYLDDIQKENLSQLSQQNLVKLFENLSDLEKQVAQTASVFDTAINEDSMYKIFSDRTPPEISETVAQLRRHGIFVPKSASISLRFNSMAVKNYCYGTIENKKLLHHLVAQKLEHFEDIDPVEIATLYEKADDYERSYKILNSEIEKANKLSVYNYEKSLLEKCSSFPFDKTKEFFIKVKLADVNLRIGNLHECIEIIDRLQVGKVPDEFESKLNFMKAKSLIGLGRHKESLALFLREEKKSQSAEERLRILTEIAGIHLDLNQYENVKKISDQIINHGNVPNSLLGKIYNILGLVNYYTSSDLDLTLNEFKKALEYYEKNKDLMQVAGMEVNIGNILYLKKEREKALRHWSKALQINKSVGNIEQEANNLMNLGIYHFDNFNVERAIENYKRAYNIFIGVGNKLGSGLSLSNLGESYLEICEYDSAFKSLKQAEEIFTDLQNTDELFEVEFTLAKLFYRLGMRDNLTELLENILSKHENDPGKLAKICYLKIILTFSDEENLSVSVKKEINRHFEILKEEDPKLFNYILAHKIEHYIKLGDYEDIENDLEVLSNSEFVQNNVFLAAWTKFLSGMFLELGKQKTKEPGIQLILEAFENLQDQSINEVTLKILIFLMNYYKERGNRSVVEKYSAYVSGFHDYLLTQTETEEIKTAINKFFNSINSHKNYILASSSSSE